MEGFDPTHTDFEPAKKAVVESIFSNIGYPPLKSDVVHIINVPGRERPLYRSDTPHEEILVTVPSEPPRQLLPGNYPCKFAYQLAHEFGHMSARADLRFPRRDGLNWIEETLAEAHSLIAIRKIAETAGPLQENARKYDVELHQKNREVPINREWYAANGDRLCAMESVDDRGESLARYLFDRVPHDRILADNRLLLELGTGRDLATFLEIWRQRGGDGTSVPSILAALLP